MKNIAHILLVASTLMMMQGAQAQSRPAARRPVAPRARPKVGAAMMKDGVLMKDGTTTQLHEGDYVSLTGRIETRAEIVAQDSIQKLQAYDLKHPGKRKEMEKAREKAEKAKEKVDKEKEKAKAKAKK